MSQNHALESLTLRTNLIEALSCLLKSTNKPLADILNFENAASVGAAHVSKLTLHGNALSEIGDKFNLVGYRDPAGTWVLRDAEKQKQLCMAAFRGLTHAKEIEIEGEVLRTYLEAEAAENPTYPRATPLLCRDVIDVLSQAPALQKLGLPMVRPIERESRTRESQEIHEAIATQLSAHPQLTSLRVGDDCFERSEIGASFQRVMNAE